jgi:carbon starvation protein
MSSLAIAVISIIIFILGYKFYAKKLEGLWHIDPKRATPAYSKFDSVDYIPAKNWLVLFGHHFASIAGAGPIIGPVIAVMLWGWLPAVLWVVFGSIFIGGPHDFGSLITSVKEGGSSVADIAEHAISRRAKLFFLLFVLLALILIIAVFAYLCADTFVKEPKTVLPSLGLIPVAIITGYLLYNLKANSVLATIFGLSGLAGLLSLGNYFPIRSGVEIWLLVLFIYCYAASVLPVNLLLQPRDYLSSFLLFFGVAAGYLGLVFSRPVIHMPYFNAWGSSGGSLWPMLFVTVACGAVSGFHALIASGTTSKQIASERHAKRIGYGGMLTEGLVAVLAIIATAILFRPGEGFTGLDLKGSGPIGVFGKGYGVITSSLLGDYGPFIAITILNAFILTTLDTATRIARYLCEELLGIKNRFLATALIIILSGTLAFSGKWNLIWPVFGAANQLVGALALFVLSCWLIAKGKPVKLLLIPAFFMLATALAALILQTAKYFVAGDLVLVIASTLLIVLSVFMLYEVIPLLLRRKQHA